MSRILRPARFAAMALALSLHSLPSMCTAALAAPPSGSIVIALSPLGDLSSFRPIAQDTLALVEKGDIAAARLRAKALETAWDEAEPNLKSKDAKAWTALDTMIDAALADLRTPSPKVDECAVSLKALIAGMDQAGKA